MLFFPFRRAIFLYTLQCYLDNGLYDKAIVLSKQLHAEGLNTEFPQFHTLMGQFATNFGQFYASQTSPFDPNVYDNLSSVENSSTLSSCPPTPPLQVTQQQHAHLQQQHHQQLQHPRPSQTPPVEAVTPPGRTPAQSTAPPSVSGDSVASSSRASANRFAQQAHWHKCLKRALGDKKIGSALKAYRELSKTCKQPNVTECSTLIELLVKEERVREAACIAEDMLSRDTYPMPKIFRQVHLRFCLNYG